MDVIDQQIVRLYIVRRLPQLDAAGEIGIDRKTISRRLAGAYFSLCVSTAILPLLLTSRSSAAAISRTLT